MCPQQRGFTLIESMIVVVVLTIVVALAYPSYNRYVIRSNRSEAIEALLAGAACQERLFIRNNVYSDDQCGGATNNGFYLIGVDTSDDGQQFELTAVPQGAQTDDNCGSLSIDDRGIKTANGESGGFAAQCWSGKFATASS